MADEKKYDWKESLLKSIIYRIITITLALITAYIITGDLLAALSVASLTEFVQFINYFIFETLWTNLITRRRLRGEFEKQLVDLSVDYSSILDLAYEISQLDTFVKEIYESNVNFFQSLLENEKLKEFHEEIDKYYDFFKARHSDRGFEILK